ncbi:hypothetical protein J2X84_003461 [Pseudomonas corrugata]|nr:hypothetical protein [Pseudomonas corrugata]
MHFPSFQNHQQKHFRKTKKILLLTNYFNFRAQPSELSQVIGCNDTSDFRITPSYAPKSQFCKGFPLIRALTVRWPHSYSVRKWWKVA